MLVPQFDKFVLALSRACLAIICAAWSCVWRLIYSGDPGSNSANLPDSRATVTAAAAASRARFEDGLGTIPIFKSGMPHSPFSNVTKPILLQSSKLPGPKPRNGGRDVIVTFGFCITHW